MPEIDKDLFHLLSLVLLGLTVLLLLGVWATLSGIRKALRRQAEAADRTEAAGGAAPAASAGDVEDAVVAPQPQTATDLGLDDRRAPEVAEPAPAPIPEPSPLVDDVTAASAADEASWLPANAGPPDTADTSWEQEEERLAAGYTPTTPSDPGSDDPFATTAGAGATAEEPHAAPTESTETSESPFATSGEMGAAATDDPFTRDEPVAPRSGQAIPEDEPFERNGRWFFKRADEFLVYDETTGQWIDADPSEAGLSPSVSSSSPSAASASFGGAAAEEETSRFPTEPGTGASPDDEAAQEPAAEQRSAGGFWKCPSCGAVNGASATTCRMCFSARP